MATTTTATTKLPQSQVSHLYCRAHGESMAELERIGRSLQDLPAPSAEFQVDQSHLDDLNAILGLLGDAETLLVRLTRRAEREIAAKIAAETF